VACQNRAVPAPRVESADVIGNNRFEGEEKALRTAFQRYSIATYVSHFDGFAGERFDLDPLAAGSPVVRVKIVPGKLGDDTHILGYTMRQTAAGWKAIDVTADSSISQVAAQQEEIRSLVRSSGADGLLARLKQKTTELSDGSVR
jgi:phospholipid transport system substrate-binding protein